MRSGSWTRRPHRDEPAHGNRSQTDTGIPSHARNCRKGLQSMRRVFDEKGHEIHPFSVLKVFHFIGARRKRHYMYKWVKRDVELKAIHMCDDKGGGYWLFGQAGPDMRI